MRKLLILILTCVLTGIIFAGCSEKNSASNAAEKFPTFATVDLKGNEVTNKIFAQKKITVVNIWGTFCPPCIGEMPELGEWARNMPADAQIIGLICDVRGKDDAQTIDAAKKILTEANADFVNLLPNEQVAEYLQKVEFVPTTIFVDAQGNIVGEAVIGADVAKYKQAVENFLK